MARRAHDEIARRLRESIDSSSIPADVDAHLLDCADCAETAARHRATVARLRALPRASAPAFLADRIFAASQSLDAAARLRRRRSFLRRLAVAVPLAAAAAAVLVVVLTKSDPPRPIQFEIVEVEVPFEEMSATSPFSPTLIGDMVRRARG
jgi:hypothetical protein